jgi:mRNA-degrading endonuclease RelE of RelBE toxin-antitoxin system
VEKHRLVIKASATRDDYRVVHEIEDAFLTVYIVKVGPRREAYR